MAITYTITQLRSGSGEISSTGKLDSLKLQWSIPYQVIVTDPADGAFTGEDITEFDVLSQTGAGKLPTVNRSIYFANGKIIPYLECKSKRATRDPNKITRWTVDTRWDTGDNDAENDPIDPPAAVTDIEPNVTVELGESSRVLYDDLKDKPIRLPTGNWFNEEAVQELTTQIVTIKQYEDEVPYDVMEERRFLVNKKEYRGKPPWAWKIQKVAGNEVEVQLAGGPALAALMTYTIESNNSPNGWKLDRALIDTHYLEVANDLSSKQPFVDKKYQTYINGLVKQVDGTQLGDQLGPPDYDQFEKNFEDDFDFMQV